MTRCVNRDDVLVQCYGVELDTTDVQAVMTALGDVLRRLRMHQGIKMVELADRWQVSLSVLCRIELARRTPSLAPLVRLAGLLGVRLSDLMRAAEEQAFPQGFSPWERQSDGLFSAPDDGACNGSSWLLDIVNSAEPGSRERVGHDACDS